jgi:hypothetical protein
MSGENVRLTRGNLSRPHGREFESPPAHHHNCEDIFQNSPRPVPNCSSTKWDRHIFWVNENYRCVSYLARRVSMERTPLGISTLLYDEHDLRNMSGPVASPLLFIDSRVFAGPPVGRRAGANHHLFLGGNRSVDYPSGYFGGRSNRFAHSTYERRP